MHINLFLIMFFLMFKKHFVIFFLFINSSLTFQEKEILYQVYRAYWLSHLEFYIQIILNNEKQSDMMLMDLFFCIALIIDNYDVIHFHCHYYDASDIPV